MSTIIQARVRLPLSVMTDDKDNAFPIGGVDETEVEWREVGSCEHGTTMCQTCYHQWAEDYEVLTMTIAAEDGVHTINMPEVIAALREAAAQEGDDDAAPND